MVMIIVSVAVVCVECLWRKKGCVSGRLVVTLNERMNDNKRRVTRGLTGCCGVPLVSGGVVRRVTGGGGMSTASLERMRGGFVFPLIGHGIHKFDDSVRRGICLLRFRRLRRGTGTKRSFVVIKQYNRSVLGRCSTLMSVFMLNSVRMGETHVVRECNGGRFVTRHVVHRGSARHGHCRGDFYRNG